MITFNRNINTNGRGLWSNTEALVRCVGAALSYENDEGDFGELRIYFDTASWNVKKNSDIYTDPLFLRELREHLTNSKLAGKDVDYSEQGMQGDDYVSLDVGKPFIDSWKKKVAEFAI